MQLQNRERAAGTSFVSCGMAAETTGVTPLREVYPGVVAKFECDNPGGSHKVRAARHIVRRALEAGDIIPGMTTVIEKTGGNFGFGLTVACAEIGVPVELAVGLSFSPVKRHCLGLFGAQLIGIDMLEKGATPREVVEWHLAHAGALDKHYFYTDQFKNAGSLAAHELETGPEIVSQLAAWPQVDQLTFVSCAGTGASLTGIARCLGAAGFKTDVVLVEPAGCNTREGVFVDHRLEGMSVGVIPPFVDWALISDVHAVSLDETVSVQREFSQTHGYFIGNTSAACLAVARKIAQPACAHRKVLALIYDHGLWYVKPA